MYQWADASHTMIRRASDGAIIPAAIGNADYGDITREGADIAEFVGGAPTSDSVVAERERRLSLGFIYNFGDARGSHQIGTTDADLKGWSEVSDYADALLAMGDATTQINIVTNTGVCQVTAPEWMAIKIAAAQYRQPIWARSFVLMASNPIPTDYASDAQWS